MGPAKGQADDEKDFNWFNKFNAKLMKFTCSLSDWMGSFQSLVRAFSNTFKGKFDIVF